MAPFSNPNILKLGKSKLVVRVRQALSHHDHPPCPSNCSASPLHITLFTHSKHRFLDPGRVSFSSLSSNKPVIMAKHEEIVGEKTICQDGSLFFECQEKANSRVAVKAALRSLNVKKSRHGRIFKKVMAFGRRFNKEGNNENKGLVVNIRVVKSFIGDRDSVREVMEKSFKEAKSQAREDGDTLLLVN
ncbi:hypothetical protein POM88_051319 [Heracleum sosnowskyi]|uniref:Uncharacterized protein n=1 Tax=Heracleum sosnowskyi TaxID=360622 RepID=A0AAD8H215_9APIA|nr:hypothetical protein POM88_051317 [Heracleum sosnowskyi]KAK1358063.1 hypothetical protein POM88_051319 [Heracleum sosnowskyi]